MINKSTLNINEIKNPYIKSIVMEIRAEDETKEIMKKITEYRNHNYNYMVDKMTDLKYELKKAAKKTGKNLSSILSKEESVLLSEIQKELKAYHDAQVW